MFVMSSLALAGVGATSAVSRPLPVADCLQQWTAYQEARRNGVEALLAKAPAAVGSDLTPQQIETVRAYIATIEKLKFGCRDFAPPPQPHPRR